MSVTAMVTVRRVVVLMECEVDRWGGGVDAELYEIDRRVARPSLCVGERQRVVAVRRFVRAGAQVQGQGLVSSSTQVILPVLLTPT